MTQEVKTIAATLQMRKLRFKLVKEKSLFYSEILILGDWMNCYGNEGGIFGLALVEFRVITCKTGQV